NVWSLTFREQGSGAGYAPFKSQIDDLRDKRDDGNLNSIETLCRMLYEEIFYAVFQNNAARGKDGDDTANAAERERDEESYGEKIDSHREKFTLPEVGGLVVIAGSTNSAKSLITRGLIHFYLENVLRDENRKRRPHLLTFEDPIEKFYAKDIYTPGGAHPQQDVAMEALRKQVDYTPRQKDQDIGSLRDVLSDALRQTPKVLFVGETRRKKDWKELIDFAGTGHLVITTAHAGSLLDAMHKIFLATAAKTPANRSEVASRLLSIVHVKRAEVQGYQLGALVPALWRRVPKGLNALTAEGLASILPHSHSDDRAPSSCLGRKYFAERLLEFAEDRNLPDDLRESLIAKAIAWDLQGA
ncbi:MAG TPA: ATPase, T2SS/T4P/T4SS family, partial [Pyrinomonadaceae bacterium]|nr:ATPase, T2SS/T4P/T4SS family [Pyrinomonadaceae bacterium]